VRGLESPAEVALNSGAQAVSKEDAFLKAILDDPSDLATRLIFADWLEEQGDPRSELLRLLQVLTQEVSPPDRPGLESRLRALLESGVKPVGPFWTNSIGMRFACIPPGTFLMGSPPTEKERNDDETQHRVTLTKGYFLAVYPVTQAQWQKVMGNNPSDFKGDDLPVEQVSWEDCREFCQKLSERDGKQYRLPTEAHWEYACRAGTTTPFYFGETISTDQANYNGDDVYGAGKEGEYRYKSTPVGSFPPNAWGLYDLHGNVEEWCACWAYRIRDYETGDITDPVGPSSGEYRMLRGGSWYQIPSKCRSAYRCKASPGYRHQLVGFRLCLDLD
jgi:uncharacterized protein (TIGR02996 family)